MRSVDLFTMPIRGSTERLTLEKMAGLSSDEHATIASDPFHYQIGSPSTGLDPSRWYTDRELLSLLIKNESERKVTERKPDALTSIASTLTLHPQSQRLRSDCNHLPPRGLI